MATLLIPAASAAAGFVAFGPTGASIGWALGSAYATSQQVIESPATGDMFVATAQYGAPIARVYGTLRISGNIFWSTEKVAHTSTQSAGKSSSPKVESTSYTISQAIGLCKGPILGIAAVYENEQLIVGPGQNMPGILYGGTNTQLPDPTMQSHLGADIPAHRGLAYMVMTDLDLGTTGAPRNFSFDVVFGEIL